MSQITFKRINEATEEEIMLLKEKLKLPLDSILSDLKQEMNEKTVTIASYYKLLSTLNLYQVSNKKYVKCPFFNGHKAIMKENRILTFDTDSPNGYIMNLVDILQVLYGLCPSAVLSALGIKEEQNSFIQYVLRNFAEVKNLIRADDFSDKYPYTAKYFKSYLWFLELLIQIGEEHAKKLDYVQTPKYGGISRLSVFFASSRYLEKYLVENGYKQLDDKMIRRIINVFCTVGIFQKAMTYQVPKPLQYNNHKPYDINYLVLSENLYLDWNFELVENKVKVLIDNKVKIKTFKKTDVINTFGNFEANKVFQKMKVKKNPNDEMETDELPF